MTPARIDSLIDAGEAPRRPLAGRRSDGRDRRPRRHPGAANPQAIHNLSVSPRAPLIHSPFHTRRR